MCLADQYTFVALASTFRAIVAYRTGKRDTGTTREFIADLRERVLGTPELSTHGFLPYQPAVRSDFGSSHHGVINKPYSVVHLDNSTRLRTATRGGDRGFAGAMQDVAHYRLSAFTKRCGPPRPYGLASRIGFGRLATGRCGARAGSGKPARNPAAASAAVPGDRRRSGRLGH